MKFHNSCIGLFQTHMQGLFCAEHFGVDFTDPLQPKCNRTTMWIKLNVSVLIKNVVKHLGSSMYLPLLFGQP